MGHYSGLIAKRRASASKARPIIVFHLRFRYVYIYIDIYMYVHNANDNGRKQEGYAIGGCNCASWLTNGNLPHNVRIPADTEVEANKRPSARWTAGLCALWRGTPLGEGTRMVYLRIAFRRITTTSRTLFQRVLRDCRVFTQASPSPITVIAHLHFHSPHALLISRFA